MFTIWAEGLRSLTNTPAKRLDFLFYLIITYVILVIGMSKAKSLKASQTGGEYHMETWAVWMNVIGIGMSALIWVVLMVRQSRKGKTNNSRKER